MLRQKRRGVSWDSFRWAASGAKAALPSAGEAVQPLFQNNLNFEPLYIWVLFSLLYLVSRKSSDNPTLVLVRQLGD